MLALKNIRLRKPSKRLADKFLGPSKVLQLVGKVTYKLQQNAREKVQAFKAHRKNNK